MRHHGQSRQPPHNCVDGIDQQNANAAGIKQLKARKNEPGPNGGEGKEREKRESLLEVGAFGDDVSRIHYRILHYLTIPYMRASHVIIRAVGSFGSAYVFVDVCLFGTLALTLSHSLSLSLMIFG